jgi:hypothetical protein
VVGNQAQALVRVHGTSYVEVASPGPEPGLPAFLRVQFRAPSIQSKVLWSPGPR